MSAQPRARRAIVLAYGPSRMTAARVSSVYFSMAVSKKLGRRFRPAR